MKNKKKITVVIVCLFVVITLCGVAVSGVQSMKHTAPNFVENYMINRATIINDENRMLIGKEVQDNTPLEATHSMMDKADVENDMLKTKEENQIVNSFADKVVQPVNITNFETVDNMTPEVIIPNGSAAIFGQRNIVGWTCNIGDEVVYKFEKYPSEVVNKQTLIVGYILDGVMYPGEKFLEAKGEYKKKVEKNGEYFIYVINAASDPLTLKSGNIHIKKNEEEK